MRNLFLTIIVLVFGCNGDMPTNSSDAVGSRHITLIMKKKTDSTNTKKIVVVLDTQEVMTTKVNNTPKVVTMMPNDRVNNAYKVKYLAIHCTATPPNRDMQEIGQLSWLKRNRGWQKWGYHVVFHQDGTIQILNPHFVLDGIMYQNELVNGVKGINRHCISIAYAGGVQQKPVYDKKRKRYYYKEEDNITPQQLHAMRGFIQAAKMAIPDLQIAGHRDYRRKFRQPYKACPSFDVREKFADIIGNDFITF